MITIQEYSERSAAIDRRIEAAETDRARLCQELVEQFAKHKPGDQVRIDASYYNDGRHGKMCLIQAVSGRLWKWPTREPEVIINYSGVVVRDDGTPGKRAHEFEERYTA